MNIEKVTGYRTYILMVLTIICTVAESLGVVPSGTWAKVTAVLVSLGIMAARAGSKNDAAHVMLNLAKWPSAPQDLPGAGVGGGDIVSSLGGIVEDYNRAKARLDQLKAVVAGISGDTNPVGVLNDPGPPQVFTDPPAQVAPAAPPATPPPREPAS